MKRTADFTVPLRGSYDIHTAAEYLSVSPQTVDRLIRQGHLQAHVLEGMTHRRVSRRALDDYIARSETNGTPVTGLRSVS